MRQWVLTLPYRLRYALAWDCRLCGAVPAVFMRALLTFERRRAVRVKSAWGDPASGVGRSWWWRAVLLGSHLDKLGLSACLHFNLGTPESYGDAFRRLADADLVGRDLAQRLTQVAGFRNLVAHAYQTPDMARVHRATAQGPADLRALLARLRDLLPQEEGQ